VTPPTLPRRVLVCAAATLTVTLSACGSGGADGDTGGTVASASGAVASSSAATGSAATGSAATAGDQPFGPGCAAVPADGPSSFAGMAAVPVGAAAAATPALSTMVQAVGAAGLLDTLNAQTDVTVLAPADEAFQAVPADQLAAVVADVPQLTAVLTHHVIQGRLGPDRLAGTLTTLDNDQVTITGSGEDFTISGDQTLTGRPATVLCGNIRTANATIYVIDQVLKPQAAG
jgi:uncharacterized surface protein with fasciclin (FAS1) repeats